MTTRAPWLAVVLVACSGGSSPKPGDPPSPPTIVEPSAAVASPPVAPLLPPGTPLVAPAVVAMPAPPADPAIDLVAAGANTCAVLASGAVSCWGTGDDATHAGTHRLVGITDAVSIALTNEMTCIVHRDGRVGCGDQLTPHVHDDPDAGSATPPAAPAAPAPMTLAPMAGITEAVQVVANGDAVCVRERRGTVACWVSGGEVVRVRGLTGVRSLVMGTQAGPEWQFPLVSFACALTDGGTVSCFDMYMQAQLDPNDPRQPYDEYLAHKGVAPAQHVGRPQRLKGFSGIHELLAIGDYGRLCARGETGPYLCVGSGSTSDPEAEPDSETVRAWSGACIAHGTSVTCEHSFRGKSTIEVPGLVKLVDAYDHACALVTGGRVVCWGSDESGGLGGPHVPAPVVADVLGLTDAVDVASFGWNAMAVRSNGQLVYWGHGTGDDQMPAADRPTTFSSITDAVHIVSNSTYACVLRRAGKVSCWGRGRFMPKMLEVNVPTEITALAGARELHLSDSGVTATLADGHVVHLGDMLLGPSQSETPVPLPGAEHAVDAVVADRWICTRDKTPGPVTCHSETKQWVAPTVAIDVPDVVEMAAAPNRNSTSAPAKLAEQAPGEYHLNFPSAYVALRRATGEVVYAHLTIDDKGVPHVATSPFAAAATHLATENLGLCAISDTAVVCHSDEHDDFAPRVPPELVGSHAYALSAPTCGLRATGRVACGNTDPITAGRGTGQSASLVPVEL